MDTKKITQTILGRTYPFENRSSARWENPGYKPIR
jgi:hypothetical protein